jgi:hypothetical protein
MQGLMIDKEVIERCCRLARMTPEKRARVGEHDVFVADGFHPQPFPAFERMGVKENEFPMGCYATTWWTAQGEDKVEMGTIFFCEPFHDPGYTVETKKQARINTALREAEGFLKRREQQHVAG